MTITTKKTVGYAVLEGPIPDLYPTLEGGIGARFFEQMAKNGDKQHYIDAATGQGEAKTEVRSKAIKVAVLLQTSGIKQGHVIVISSKPHADQNIALLACWFAGATAAPLHGEYDYEDLKHALKLLQPKFAFCGSRSGKLFSRIFLEIKIRCPIITFNDDSKQFATFKKCYAGNGGANFEVTPITDPKKQPAIIMHTLGTESSPKLVAISHYNLYIRYSRLLPRFNKHEKLASLFPLSCTMHMLACCLAFESTLKLVFIKYFTEKGLCRYLQDMRVDHLFIDGDMALKVIQNAPVLEFDLKSLKTIFVAGMPLSTTNYARICNTFSRVQVNTTYQTIETGMVTIVSQDVFSSNRQKVLSTGQLYPGMAIRIVDMVTKQVVGVDKPGEVQVKSEAVMLGYHRNPELTNRAFVREFYRTGDIGTYDSDGYIYIKGRISDYITREGHTFATEDIEEVIRLNPAVSEVVCIPYKNDIIACIVKKRGEEISANTLLSFVADVLPVYKLPTKIVFRDFLPKTILGVVRKYIVKESISKIYHDDSLLTYTVVDKNLPMEK